MKKVIFLFTLITSTVNAQLVYSDNMENTGWTWKGIPRVGSKTTLVSKYVGGLTSIADSPAYSPLYSSSDSCFMLYGTGPGSSFILEKDTINYPNVTGLDPTISHRISFKLASFGLNLPGNPAAGVDVLDFVQIDWSDDGGLTYKPEIKITGFTNSTWGFNSPSGTQVTKNSTGSLSTYTSSTLTPIDRVTLDLPLNTTQLKIRITLIANSYGETWCIDDVNLSLRTILPIELLSFKAKVKNNVVALDWTTISENNNNHFILSKSKDAFNYTDIGIVSGGGNSNEIKTYRYIDEFPYDGLNYYRLSQVDDNGQVQTFDPISVKYTNTENKTITKIINAAGQEVDERYNGIKIYHFDDNTTMVENEVN